MDRAGQGGGEGGRQAQRHLSGMLASANAATVVVTTNVAIDVTNRTDATDATDTAATPCRRVKRVPRICLLH